MSDWGPRGEQAAKRTFYIHWPEPLRPWRCPGGGGRRGWWSWRSSWWSAGCPGGWCPGTPPDCPRTASARRQSASDRSSSCKQIRGKYCGHVTISGPIIAHLVLEIGRGRVRPVTWPWPAPTSPTVWRICSYLAWTRGGKCNTYYLTYVSHLSYQTCKRSLTIFEEVWTTKILNIDCQWISYHQTNIAYMSVSGVYVYLEPGEPVAVEDVLPELAEVELLRLGALLPPLPRRGRLALRPLRAASLLLHEVARRVVIRRGHHLVQTLLGCLQALKVIKYFIFYKNTCKKIFWSLYLPYFFWLHSQTVDSLGKFQLPRLELVHDGLLHQLRLIPSDGEVLELFGDHEGSLVLLQEQLLVQPRVQRGDDLLHRVHVRLLRPPDLLDGVRSG